MCAFQLNVIIGCESHDGKSEFYRLKYENVEKLKAEIAKENHEIELLKQEIQEAQTEYDEIHENLERIKKESDEYNKQRSNLRQD